MASGKPSARLKKELKARGWTQATLANKCNLSVMSLHRICLGRDARVSTWRKIAEVLGVSLSWLLSGVGCEPEQVNRNTVFMVRYDPLAVGDGRLAEFVGELQRRFPKNAVIYEAFEVRAVTRGKRRSMASRSSLCPR